MTPPAWLAATLIALPIAAHAEDQWQYLKPGAYMCTATRSFAVASAPATLRSGTCTIQAGQRSERYAVMHAEGDFAFACKAAKVWEDAKRPTLICHYVRLVDLETADGKPVTLRQLAAFNSSRTMADVLRMPMVD